LGIAVLASPMEAQERDSAGEVITPFRLAMICEFARGKSPVTTIAFFWKFAIMAGGGDWKSRN